MKFQELFPLPVEWLSDIDQSMADTVSKWAEKEVMAKRLEHGEDESGLLAPALKTLFVDLGLQNLIWPEDAGGCNRIDRATAMTLAVSCEQAARGDTGIAYLLANTFTVLASFGIEPHRNDALLSRFQASFCNGEHPVLASLVLPGYGEETTAPSPALHGLTCQVTAAEKKKDLVLSGEKIRPTCSGASAVLIGTFCLDQKGELLFVLVPADAKGVQAGNPVRQTGLAAAQAADISFTDVTVPKSHAVLFGDGGYQEIMGWYFLGCAACCSGALLAGWEILKDWGDNRVIKGKGQVFKENPLVAAHMGKIGAKIGTARLLVYNLARMISRPELYGPPDSLSMFATATSVVRTVCRAAMEGLNHSMEMMASAGYATEWNLERYWRDVRTIESHLGPVTKSQTDLARHYFDCRSL